MPERSVEQRWVAHIMNSVDAQTEQAAGQRVTYSPRASLGQLITPDAVLDPDSFSHARREAINKAHEMIDAIFGAKIL